MAIKVNNKFVAGGKGADGKSAYQYAVDGGYTGTEAEFQTLMAKAKNLDGGPFLPLDGSKQMAGNLSLNSNQLDLGNNISFGIGYNIPDDVTFFEVYGIESTGSTRSVKFVLEGIEPTQTVNESTTISGIISILNAIGSGFGIKIFSDRKTGRVVAQYRDGHSAIVPIQLDGTLYNPPDNAYTPELEVQLSSSTDGYQALSVGEPSNPFHSATKKYVDDSIKAAIIDSWAAAY